MSTGTQQPGGVPQPEADDLRDRFEAVRGHLRGVRDAPQDDRAVFEALFEAFWDQHPMPEVDAEQQALLEACQRARERADAGVSASAEKEDPEAVELPCGCPAAYEQAGECLIHDQRFNTDEERRVEQQTATDGLEGRL